MLAKIKNQILIHEFLIASPFFFFLLKVVWHIGMKKKDFNIFLKSLCILISKIFCESNKENSLKILFCYEKDNIAVKIMVTLHLFLYFWP